MALYMMFRFYTTKLTAFSPGQKTNGTNDGFGVTNRAGNAYRRPSSFKIATMASPLN